MIVVVEFENCFVMKCIRDNCYTQYNCHFFSNSNHIVKIKSCRLTKRKSIVDCLTDSKNKKIDYWIDVENSSKKIDTIDWISIDFDEQKNRLLIVVVTNSLIDWFSKQKNQQLIVIFANSRSFSLIHDAHNEQHSSFSKKKFHILTIFFNSRTFTSV